MAARWLARAARDAAGLCTKAAWHAAVAASRVRCSGARQACLWPPAFQWALWQGALQYLTRPHRPHVWVGLRPPQWAHSSTSPAAFFAFGGAATWRSRRAGAAPVAMLRGFRPSDELRVGKKCSRLLQANNPCLPELSWFHSLAL